MYIKVDASTHSIKKQDYKKKIQIPFGTHISNDFNNINKNIITKFVIYSIEIPFNETHDIYGFIKRHLPHLKDDEDYQYVYKDWFQVLYNIDGECIDKKKIQNINELVNQIASYSSNGTVRLNLEFENDNLILLNKTFAYNRGFSLLKGLGKYYLNNLRCVQDNINWDAFGSFFNYLVERTFGFSLSGSLSQMGGCVQLPTNYKKLYRDVIINSQVVGSNIPPKDFPHRRIVIDLNNHSFYSYNGYITMDVIDLKYVGLKNSYGNYVVTDRDEIDSLIGTQPEWETILMVYVLQQGNYGAFYIKPYGIDCVTIPYNENIDYNKHKQYMIIYNTKQHSRPVLYPIMFDYCSYSQVNPTSGLSARISTACILRSIVRNNVFSSIFKQNSMGRFGKGNEIVIRLLIYNTENNTGAITNWGIVMESNKTPRFNIRYFF